MARNRYDVDETLEDHFDINQLKRLGGYVKPYLGKMFFIMVLMLSSSALTMLIPKFVQLEMDRYIPQKDMNGIIRLVIYTFLIVLYSVICMWLKIDQMTKVGQDIIHEIREDLFAHLQELPFSYYDERPHGKIQVRVVNYVNNLSDLLSNGILNTITDLCNLIFAVFFHNVINDFLSSVDTEININIWHRYTFRIQESFKQQIVPKRLDIRNIQTIGYN
mgnify:CR=1 FL=1